MKNILREIPNNDWVLIYLIVVLLIFVFLKKSSDFDSIKESFRDIFFLGNEGVKNKSLNKVEYLESTIIAIFLQINWAILLMYIFKGDQNFFFFALFILIAIELFTRLFIVLFQNVFQETELFTYILQKKNFYEKGVLILTFCLVLLYHYTDFTFFSSLIILMPVLIVYLIHKLKALFVIYTSAKIQVTYIFMYLCVLEISPLLWGYHFRDVFL